MFKRIFGLAGLLCALGVIGVGAGSASAQTANPFGCTAGTATASLSHNQPAARDDRRQRGEHALRD